MKLTKEQREKAAASLGLVYRVIRDKVRPPYPAGLAYEDLVQIGSIGLCKAAATDKGGTFSTYAYRLIWNEICDALISFNRRQARESSCDLIPEICGREDDAESRELGLDLRLILEQAGREAAPCVEKGIRAIELRAQGYSREEISRRMRVSPGLVSEWMYKARKFLKSRQEFAQLKAVYGS